MIVIATQIWAVSLTLELKSNVQEMALKKSNAVKVNKLKVVSETIILRNKQNKTFKNKWELKYSTRISISCCGVHQAKKKTTKYY